MPDLRSQITPSLIARYNRPGPRYTSYPTAPQFCEDFDVVDYAEALGSGHERPLSLYFHLPFCKSLCYYCGCHMMVTSRPERIDEYLTHLIREIQLVAGLLEHERPVTHVHWGGGTPTFLSPHQMKWLMLHIRDRFHVVGDAEVSIEADPRTLTEQHVDAARCGGFNRVSLGVQDLDERVQEAIGRIQPEEMVIESVRQCRRAGFDGISLDLIYGLPHQTTETFRDTLTRVLAMEPDRLSVFSYAHVPWIKKHQRAIPQEALPTPEAKMDLFLMAIEMLTEAGYRHVGMDHFARPDDPLCVAQDEGRLHRNFQGYATDAGCDLVGLGLSSISQLDRMYVQNEKGLDDYYRRIECGTLPVHRGLVLTQDDVVRRYVIMRLMCDFAIDRRDVESRFDLEFDAYFARSLDALAELERGGLVTDDGHTIRATDAGRLLIRNVAMPFDAFLAPDVVAGRPTYSQTV